MEGVIKEECGVFGLYLPEKANVASITRLALYALQHRGQEGCGIAVNSDGVIHSHKDAGLVSDIFTRDVLNKFPLGRSSVGHVRYGTTGNNPRLNTQPLVVNHLKGRMALAHNGNLTNDAELRESLELTGSIFHTTTDSEVIAYTITKNRITKKSIEESLEEAMNELEGAFSLVIMSPSKLVAARDKHGFRPLSIGTLDGGYVFSSETCAFDAIGAKFLRDVEPGEIVVVNKDGVLKSITTHTKKAEPKLCVFEFVYFARPDSIIDSSSVQTARNRAGAFLSLESPVQADVVIGVPDSGLDAALGYSRQSGIPYGVGFIKNRYIGRTFIEPDQKDREDAVRIKLNPVKSVVEGKRVILIDDSIVRGTTSKQIVKLLREAGAKEVHFRSAAPKFLNPCYYGTDIDSQENLFAYKYTDEEMMEILDVDSLGFLSVDHVTKLAEFGKRGFCTACFSGIYPTNKPSGKGKDKYSQPIGDINE